MASVLTSNLSRLVVLYCLDGESREREKKNTCMKEMKEINEGTKYERTDMAVEFRTGFYATVN